MKKKLSPSFISTRVFFLILPLITGCGGFFTSCKSDEFNCDSWECKPISLLCDGKIDCWTKVDETFEQCQTRRCNTTQFHCASGACIPLSLKCNTERDCFDGSDEVECENMNTNECPYKMGKFPNNVLKILKKEDWQVRCLSGECIREDQVCDGIQDCTDSSDETYTKCSDTRCSSDSFQCNYGACIDLERVCDGTPDCVDYSDELLPKCNIKLNVTDEMICGFQCNTGLCIKQDKLCDGIRDCDDGSDETYRQCHNFNCGLTAAKRCTYGACMRSDANNCVNNYYPNDISKGSGNESEYDVPDVINPITPCQFPNQPENGAVTTNTGLIPDPSIVAPEWTIIKFKCNEGYTLGTATSVIVCNDDGYWSHTFPECLKTCPPLQSKNHKIECLYQGHKIACNKAFEGSIADVKCKNTFEIKKFVSQPYNGIKCQNGAWSKKLFDCNPVCGTLKSKAQPLVINGYTAPEQGFPWHAGIYKRNLGGKYQQMCGGTLILKAVVVTAAHCFYNGNKRIANRRKYAVAVGKFYRTWKSPNDKYAQYKQIKKIIIHEKFRAEESAYANDIAILILRDPVQFTARIRPICIDWSKQLYKRLFKRDHLGTVPGWGLTKEFGTPAEELQVVKLPYVEYKTCIRGLPEDFRPFITHDKICAGNNNGSNVCTGDSGGGYAFKSNNRYYLSGIVSVAPAKHGPLGNTCDSHKYVTFTSFPQHLELIKHYEALYNHN